MGNFTSRAHAVMKSIFGQAFSRITLKKVLSPSEVEQMNNNCFFLSSHGGYYSDSRSEIVDIPNTTIVFMTKFSTSLLSYVEELFYDHASPSLHYNLLRYPEITRQVEQELQYWADKYDSVNERAQPSPLTSNEVTGIHKNDIEFSIFTGKVPNMELNFWNSTYPGIRPLNTKIEDYKSSPIFMEVVGRLPISSSLEERQGIIAQTFSVCDERYREKYCRFFEDRALQYLKSPAKEPVTYQELFSVKLDTLVKNKLVPEGVVYLTACRVCGPNVSIDLHREMFRREQQSMQQAMLPGCDKMCSLFVNTGIDPLGPQSPNNNCSLVNCGNCQQNNKCSELVTPRKRPRSQMSSSQSHGFSPTSEHNINNVCNKLKSAKNIWAVLKKESYITRNLFLIASLSKPEYPLSKQILSSLVDDKWLLCGKRIVSWNVDSLRSNILGDKFNTKKGSELDKLISEVDPELICLQETKIQQEMETAFKIPGYHCYWNSSKKQKGYSGVALFSKTRPIEVRFGLEGIPDVLQEEGRIISAFFNEFVIVNVYAPNTLRAGTKPRKGWGGVKDKSKAGAREKDYNYYMGNRMIWEDSLRTYLISLKTKYKSVILCGDLNVARTTYDIHNGHMTQGKLNMAIKNGESKSRITALEKRVKDAKIMDDNGGGAGFRHEEREKLELLVERDFTDVYRFIHPVKNCSELCTEREYGFTFWDRTKKAFRPSNNGWRIDYFIVSNQLLPFVRNIKVLKHIGELKGDIYSSDHAPLVLYF